jgi:hypothetical protein
MRIGSTSVLKWRNAEYVFHYNYKTYNIHQEAKNQKTVVT